MNLTELMNAVYVETVRPDLVDQTKQKIKAATMQLHCIDFFYKDIQSAQVHFDTVAYIQQLETSSLPFYRSLSYMRKDDPTLAAYQLNPTILPPIFTPGGNNSYLATKKIEVITPDALFDEFETERLDVAYQAGACINIKSSTPLEYMLLGYYRYPDLQDATFDSWIAREFPYAIVYEATSAIFTMTGQQDQSRKYDDPNSGLASVQRRLLQTSNITPEGR